MGSCMSKACTRSGDPSSPSSAHRGPATRIPEGPAPFGDGATNPMVVGPSTAAGSDGGAINHRGNDDVRPFLDDSFDIEDDNVQVGDLTVESVGATPSLSPQHALQQDAAAPEDAGVGRKMERSNTQAFHTTNNGGGAVGGNIGLGGPRRRSSSSTTGHSSGGGGLRASLSVVSFDGGAEAAGGGGSFRRRRSSTLVGDHTVGPSTATDPGSIADATTDHVRTSVTSLAGSTSSVGWKFTVRPVSSKSLVDVDPASSNSNKRPPPADPLLLSANAPKGRGRVRLASSAAQQVGGSGSARPRGLRSANADSPTMSMTSRASSVASFAMRSVVPFDFLESNVMRRDRASEAPRTLCDHMFPALLLTHDDIVQSTGSMDSGDLCGPVLVVGDCGEDIVAAVMVLSTMETYCVEEHGRLLSTLFAHVIATGSGGFVALSLSQGETMASLLELLLQNDSSLLRKRGAGTDDAGFHSDGVGAIDALMQMRFADQRIDEGTTSATSKSSWQPMSPSGPRRMCHRYRRGDYYVARPCIVVAERGGSFLRRIDWTSKALVHRLVAVSANCIANVNDTGLALLGDDTEDVYPAVDALPDPVLLAMKITPRPTAVCRISVPRKRRPSNGKPSCSDDGEDAEDTTATDMMSAEFRSDFVDIGLPTFVSPRTSPTAAALSSSKPDRGKASAQHRSSLQSFTENELFQSQGPTGALTSMSGASFGLDVTPLDDLLMQWNLSGVDKQRRVAIMNQTEAFIEENEGSLQRAVDYLAVKAAKPHTMTPPECALQFLPGHTL